MKSDKLSIREIIEDSLRKDIEQATQPELFVYLASDPAQHGRLIAVNHEQKESLFIQWEKHAAWHTGDEVKKLQ